MWTLQETGTTSERAVTFRVRPGSAKTIGRAVGADFILEAPLVSRVHCRVEADHQRLEVVDLSSTNGTFVNGRRIERAQLKEGDRLRVGRVELIVQSPPGDANPS
ncbi:MAG TPA: FHA domain-containing protein [Vicinamibacterales bacterium]|nr:FHA domain-containing protein [Vicinamibacterales bacterium]